MNAGRRKENTIGDGGAGVIGFGQLALVVCPLRNWPQNERPRVLNLKRGGEGVGGWGVGEKAGGLTHGSSYGQR